MLNKEEIIERSKELCYSFIVMSEKETSLAYFYSIYFAYIVVKFDYHDWFAIKRAKGDYS